MRSDGPTIVISGAGGWVFPLELARDILSFPALTGSRLVLYDIDRAGRGAHARVRAADGRRRATADARRGRRRSAVGACRAPTS